MAIPAKGTHDLQVTLTWQPSARKGGNAVAGRESSEKQSFRKRKWCSELPLAGGAWDTSIRCVGRQVRDRCSHQHVRGSWVL